MVARALISPRSTEITKFAESLRQRSCAESLSNKCNPQTITGRGFRWRSAQSHAANDVQGVSERPARFLRLGRVIATDYKYGSQRRKIVCRNDPLLPKRRQPGLFPY